MDKHDLIVALKDLALELGRTPRRTEFFSKIKNGQQNIEINFGSYTTLVMAAGLEVSKFSKTKNGKLTNEIFKRDIEEVVQDYTPREDKPKIEYAPTLFIGDTHFPFANQRILQEIYKFASDNKPKRIVQVGDLYDMYGHSKFPKSLNIYTPEHEENLARKQAEEMWKILKETCPKAECVQLKGNHDLRPLKQTLATQAPLEHMVSYYLDKIMSFDGVKLITDPRQEYEFDDVLTIHGYRTQLGSHRDYSLMKTVHGHSHKGGVVFRRIRGETLWELDVGFTGDAEAKAFGYTPQKIYDGTVGLGWLDGYGPRFIPF